MSTARPRLYNRDGTRNIYCPQCHNLVGTTSLQSGINFGTAVCAICYAVNNGETLSAETIEQLRTQRTADGMLLPQFLQKESRYEEEARAADPMGYNPEDIVAGGKSWFKSFGIQVKQTLKDIITKTPGSQKLANQKKRKRVFDRPISDMLDEDDKD